MPIQEEKTNQQAEVTEQQGNCGSDCESTKEAEKTETKAEETAAEGETSNAAA